MTKAEAATERPSVYSWNVDYYYRSIGYVWHLDFV